MQDVYATHHVAAPVLDELAHLITKGVDVAFADPPQTVEVPLEIQARVDAALREQVARPDFQRWLFDAETHPAGKAWWGIHHHAICLHTFYQVASDSRPAAGIPMESLDFPLYRGRSAREVIQAEKSAEVAAQEIAAAEAFLAAGDLTDHQDEYGLTSRDYLMGAVDAHAVRSRMETVKLLIREHFEAQGPRTEPLRIASVFSSAVAPTIELGEEFGSPESPTEYHLIDPDIISVAMARGVAVNAGVAERTTVHRKHILKTPMREYLGRGTFDVVDLVGVMDYVPRSKAGWHIASTLLSYAREVLRPGGLIVFDNMLVDRPQQPFLDAVWPKLYQRTVSVVLDIAKRAGLGSEVMRIRVPRREGVYAVFGATAPTGNQPTSFAELPGQRALRRLLLSRAPTY